MRGMATRWRRERRRDDTVLLDGFHAIKHAARFGAEIQVIITDDKRRVLELAQQLASDVFAMLDQELVELETQDFTELVSKPHPTRVAAIAVRPSLRHLRERLYSQRSSPVVLLDNPRHLGNVGAVVRLAAGFGIAGVLTTGTLDPWHADALRGGAGLHFATAVLSTTPDALPAGPIFALDPGGRDIRSVALPNDVVLAFGSERHGISEAIRLRSDHLIAIPMRSLVSSYNLATSVAMALYHWTLTASPDVTRADRQ